MDYHNFSPRNLAKNIRSQPQISRFKIQKWRSLVVRIQILRADVGNYGTENEKRYQNVAARSFIIKFFLLKKHTDNFYSFL